ncbi:MAG: hypothetical protein KA144_03790 [Xanthomonadaceae bacterium]|nr:hypothetical protein [Xanthomonadaceae bacterium]
MDPDRSQRAHAPTRTGTRASIVAGAATLAVITLGFVVQALRRGYGFPSYLLQADYALSLTAATALSLALMWRWRARLGWFQVPMAPVLTYTFLALLALALRSG